MVIPHPTNAVLVGRKPVMNYVVAALRMMAHEGLDEIVIKARGANIYKAVEVAESLRRTLQGVMVKNVNIKSEEVVDRNGKSRRISSIEIIIARSRA